MSDLTTDIVNSAEEGLAVLDEQIAQMRAQRKGLAEGIAQALERRKPLARIVRAARGRKAGGDV